MSFRANHVAGSTLRGADADNFPHNSQNVDGRRTMLIQNFKDHHPAFYLALGDLPAQIQPEPQYDRERRALAAQNQKVCLRGQFYASLSAEGHFQESALRVAIPVHRGTANPTTVNSPPYLRVLNGGSRSPVDEFAGARMPAD
jgi:hypothetical protein